MKQFRIGARIYFGFGSIVALGLAVAGFGIVQSMHVRQQVDMMGILAEDVSRSLQVSRLLEAISGAEASYNVHPDEAVLAELRNNETQARALLAQSAATAPSPERRHVYAQLLDAFRAHDDSLDAFIQLSREAADARSRLFAGGDTLAMLVSHLFVAADIEPGWPDLASASQVNAAVLLAEVANWRFIATDDPKGQATLARSLDKGSAALAAYPPSASPDEKALIGEVKNSLAAFGTDFRAFASARLKGVDLYHRQLQPAILGMQNRLQTTHVSLQQDFATRSHAARQLARQTSLLQALLAALGFGLGTMLALLIGRGIVRPLTRMTAAMTSLARGDKGIEVPARSNSDEIGDMARAVEVFKQNAVAADRLASEQAAEREAKEQRASQLENMVHAFQHKVGGLVSLLASASSEMEATAGSMSANATQTNEQAELVAAAAEQASTSVQSVSAAAEQLTASIGEIGRQVEQSARITGRAVEDARRTDEIVQALSEGARKIEDVVGLISGIAGQTNLLALNATIEAARAGDAGKGFAVVASEVKSLAQQTRLATEEISTQIGQIQAASLDAVNAIGSIARIVTEVSAIATAIAAAVEEQGAATAEIARNVEQTARAARDVTATIGGVSIASNDTGRAASQVFGAASGLSRQAEQLTGEVDLFVAAVRAA